MRVTIFHYHNFFIMAVRENLYFNQHELGQNYYINIIHQVFFRLNAGLGKGCEYNLSDFSKAFHMSFFLTSYYRMICMTLQ